MFRYLKPKGGKLPVKPKKRRRGLQDFSNGARRQRTKSSFSKRRGSLMNSFGGTKRQKKTKNVSRSTAIAAAAKDPDVQKLHSKQKEVLDLILEGRNVFFTGSAGTGKSHVLRLAMKHLESVFPRKVHIVAPTGVAACNIGGTTIHSFSGIGLGDGDKETLLRRVRSKRIPRRRWQEAKVLVIDEVSMLSASLFDSLAYIAQKIRSCALPFGGLQLILCGDFFQLPPINARQLCFQSERFQHSVKNKIVLTENFRQNDSKLISILNQIRTGIVTPEAERVLKGTAQRKLDTKDAVVPTRLFSHNQQVKFANDKAFRVLKGKTYTFEADDFGDKWQVKSLQKNCQALQVLHLKVGSQVILLKNLSIESGLVNGSQGIVLEFRAEHGEGGEEDRTLYPVVEFTTPYGKRKRLVQREDWTINTSGQTVATRSQIPLRLAWGLSIHKSQGMTIEKLEVNLDKIFEPGQAYVALSRCTSLDGLRVLGFNKSKIRADPRVIKFHREMGDLLPINGSAPAAPAAPTCSPMHVLKSCQVESSTSKTPRKYTVQQLAGSCKHTQAACSAPIKPAIRTPKHQVTIDLTEEEEIMVAFGAQLEEEAVQKSMRFRAASQFTAQPPKKKQREVNEPRILDPDDEEAMIMAEYSAECAEEVPDEFFSSMTPAVSRQNSSMIKTPSSMTPAMSRQSSSMIETPETTSKIDWKYQQRRQFVSDFPSKTPDGKNGAAKGDRGKCFSCGQPGHWASKCPLKSQTRQTAGSSFTPKSDGWISRRTNSAGHFASAYPNKFPQRSKWSRRNNRF